MAAITSPSVLSLPDRIAAIPHALTAVEVAELLGISRITVFKYAKKGILPSLRIGTSVRFDPAAIAEFLKPKRSQ